MRENVLAALVTQTATGMVATHLPLMLEDDGSQYGVLKGHIARGNSQWKEATLTADALAIFSGPEHYISASWYPGTKTHGREVPTWNYVAVHAYGRLRIVEDAAWLLKHLTELTDRNEAISELPWKVSDAPPDFIAKMSAAIVGLELTITELQGKWKASQNRSEEDATAVMEGLGRLGTPSARTMKEIIRTRRQP
jgi:transcriptional regulator